MITNRFLLPGLSPVDFTISYSELDRASPLNHNESHIHKDCEIYMNLGGSGSFEVEQYLYPVTRGSVIITRPYEYHHYIYRDDGPQRHYWITFSVDRADESLSLFFDREKGCGNLIQLEENEVCEIQEIFEGFLRDRQSPLEKQIGFLRMLHILYGGRQIPHGVPDNGLTPDVLAALQYIHQHLTEDLGVKTLAAVSNVSINTLERHFKEQLQLSPGAMIRKTRLIRSLQYLRQGSTIAEAAVRSGFSDYSNYIQLFRKQFGITPLQYRKNFA